MRFLVLLWCLAGVPAIAAVSLPASAHAASDKKTQKKKLKKLKKENKGLRKKIAKAEREESGAFQQATGAENTLGLRSLRCHAVTSGSMPAGVYPKSGERHIRLVLRRGRYEAKPSFSTPRTVRNYTLHPGNCQVSR